MDCAEERIGGEEVSTDSSLNFCCEWNQRNGIGYEIRGEFQIGDIRASIYLWEQSFRDREIDSAGERSDIYRREAFGKGRRRRFFILLV